MFTICYENEKIMGRDNIYKYKKILTDSGI